MKLPRQLWVLLLLGFALRVGIIFAVGDIPLFGDERDYNGLAVRLADDLPFGYVNQDGVEPTSYRAPGHPFWLSMLYRGFGENHMLARVGQSALMMGAGLLFFLIGRELFGKRVGLLSAGIFTFDPLLIAFSTWLWAEPLYLLLSAGAFCLLIRVAKKIKTENYRKMGVWVGIAGIFWGLATLTRESGLLLGLLIAGWLLLLPVTKKRKILLPAIFLLGMIVTIAPWTIRNWRVHQAFVPVTSVSGLAMWLGNNEWGEWQPVFDRYFQPDTEMERESLAMREAQAYIINAQPQWLLQKLSGNLPAFLGPENFLIRHIREGIYGDVSDFGYGVAYFVTWAYWVGVGITGIYGLWFGITNRTQLFLWLPVLALLIADIALHAHSRHRIVVLPILAITTGWAWHNRHHIRRQLQNWRNPRWWGAMGSLALFVFLNIPFKRVILSWLF